MSARSTGEAEAVSPKPKGGEESEEECEVLEESPCGRWQKRREEVRKSPYYVLSLWHLSIYRYKFNRKL